MYNYLEAGYQTMLCETKACQRHYHTRPAVCSSDWWSGHNLGAVASEKSK